MRMLVEAMLNEWSRTKRCLRLCVLAIPNLLSLCFTMPVTRLGSVPVTNSVSLSGLNLPNHLPR
jgi:hypothetical protein